MRLYPKRGALIVPVAEGEAEHVVDARLLIEVHAAQVVAAAPRPARRWSRRCAPIWRAARPAAPGMPRGSARWMPTSTARCVQRRRQPAARAASTTVCASGNAG